MKDVAEILRYNSQKIIGIWEDRVRGGIKASKANTKIALYDHLPIILEDLASIFEDFNILDNPYEDLRYHKIIEGSVEHGRHRAATPAYTLEGLVNEYIIFHKVVTEILRAKGVLQPEVFDLIKYSIETAILKSVNSFSQSIDEMQHKIIGTLAHDIRNPLSTAKLAVEMMGMDIDKKRSEKLGMMSLSGINKALKLVEELLDTISIKAGDGMSFNFEEIDVLKEVRLFYQEAQEIYSVPLHFECKIEESVGVFDPTAIRRLLENLVTNAVKYGSGQHPITINLKDDGMVVTITVHNYGKPIPEGKQQSIFEFLEHGMPSPKDGPKSWGIGLTLVKMVAEAHGGAVKLISNEKEGTSFVITLEKYFKEPGKIKAGLWENA